MQAPALLQLANNRHLLRPIRHSQAASLLRVLTVQQADAQAATHALQLLSRFAQQQHHFAQGLHGGGGDAHAGYQHLLLQAVDATLRLAEGTQLPLALVTASLLFLGTAVRALPNGAAAKADVVVAALCRLLDVYGPAIAGSGLLELQETTAGISHSLCAAQVSTEAAQWLLSGLLAAWSDVGHPGAPAGAAQLQLEQLAPLWRLMQVVGHTLARQGGAPPPHQQHASAAERLHGLAGVLCNAIADGGAVQSAAGLLAAAGFTQGLRSADDATLSVLVHLAAWLPPACVAALEAVESAIRGGAAAEEQLATLRRDAASLATLVASQAGPGEAQAPCAAAELRCQAGTLLGAVMDLAPLHAAVAAGRPPEAAARAMQAHAGGLLMQHAGPLSSRVLEAYQQASCDTRAAVQQTVLRAVARFADSYGACAARAPPGWLLQAEGLGSSQALDRAFATAMPLLFAMWTHAQRTVDAGGTAALVLETLACLHFARMQHGLYSDLVQGTLAEVAGSDACSRRLAAAMPEYGALAAAPAPGVQPAWLADPALGARAQFMCSVLATCAQRLPQADLQRLMPVALLLVHHPSASANVAAHSLFGALLQALHEGDREAWAAAYAARALPAYPAAVSGKTLAAALDAAAKLLPVGSMAPVLIARQLAGRCRQLLAAAGAMAHHPAEPLSGPGSLNPKGPAAGGVHDLGPGEAAAAALSLAQLLAHLLLVVDFHVLPDVTDAAEAAALAAPPTLQQQVCGAMYDVLAASDDYIRKVDLMRWHQRLLHHVSQTSVVPPPPPPA